MSELISGQDRYFIRRMREDDLPAVRAIEGLSFSNPWSDNTFRGEIQNMPVSSPLVVVRRPGEEVVGYIIYWQIRDDVQVNNIAVHPECRGLGLGEAMMRFAIAKVRAAGAEFMTLEVRQSNVAAVTLYKKLGFEVLGTRKNYYTKPDEDACVLGLVLDQ
ncbi:MAG: ribosomal-protein-alanine N-acetyltransferase [Candidatus Aminicenantes bacterium RBG_16_66_30]|nr:MAG: ribosomal-protein-alanine N-acetyltransferase [Candidatus Aminicenantes bacterium RBG_16_66_30]